MTIRTVRREVSYRGYKIKLERWDLCWRVILLPTRPELPNKRRSFRTITQSERGAMSQAKQRVDREIASAAPDGQ